MKSGRKAWTIIGAYIPPSETDGFTLAAIRAARDSAPARRPVIMMGDLNVDLTNIRTGDGEARRLETAALVDSLELVDVQRHFRIRKWNEGSWTWSMRRNGTRIRSRCDYILTDSYSDFTRYRILTPRLDTDHRMITGYLKLDCREEHRKYVRKRKTIPRRRLRPEQKTRADIILEEVTEDIKKPEKTDSREQSWISVGTWW